MAIVIKKDDRKEDFNREKVRRGIENAAKRVKIDKKKAREIADKISRDIERNFADKNEVKSADIRDRILRALDREEKRVAKEFRAFKK